MAIDFHGNLSLGFLTLEGGDLEAYLLWIERAMTIIAALKVASW